MGTGRILFRTGLLVLLLSTAIHAQETGPGVSYTISPEIIHEGEPFTVSLVVDYPYSQHITLITPDFNDDISIDRITQFPRSIGGKVYTIIECRLIPGVSGLFTLGEFQITTAGGTAKTEPIILNILSDGKIIFTPQFHWFGAPEQTAAGNRLTLTLQGDNVRPGGERVQYPPPSFFNPEVPKGVILSQAPVSPQERERGIVLKLTLIPLEAGVFNLPARSLQYEGIPLEIPELNIRITERER